jgi:hypothetical protein
MSDDDNSIELDVSEASEVEIDVVGDSDAY